MRHIPNDTADKLDNDSCSAKTGARPRDQVARTPGEQGVEAVVEEGADLPASAVRGPGETARVARERVEADGPTGQG